mmetsp:Transcript_21797/g.27096  ORF Transcript_21797/g.27096 Transcript_21797/m.27096 type:complete len:291 (-) Transcript_21797:89-961(-)
MPRKLSQLCGPWLLRGNDVKGFEALQNIKGLSHDSHWRENSNSVCFDTDRCFAWTISCNKEIISLFPSPWITYGALLDYLLRPSNNVRKRLKKSSSFFDKNTSCILGVHLRKEDSGSKPSSIWVDNEKNPDYDVVQAFKKQSMQQQIIGGVYVASDDQSVATKRYILEQLRKAHIPIISSVARRATRRTIDGIVDAVAENFMLSTCQDILPRGIGKSTFHDVAVARAAFLHNWDQNRIFNFVNFRAHEHRYATVPSFCPPSSHSKSKKATKEVITFKKSPLLSSDNHNKT